MTTSPLPRVPQDVLDTVSGRIAGVRLPRLVPTARRAPGPPTASAVCSTVGVTRFDWRQSKTASKHSGITRYARRRPHAGSPPSSPVPTKSTGRRFC